MKIIPFSVNSGKDNMQIDEDLLVEAINSNSDEMFLRTYAWSPACMSLGRNQDNSFIDFDLVNELGIDVVRRLTGGRALLHDKELTYCIVTPESKLKNGTNVIKSYIEISQFLIDIFKQLDIELKIGGDKVSTKNEYCMLVSTGADLCYNGKKFIGSAQCRRNGYILQHGSILLDYDKNLLSKLFKEEVSSESVISLNQINPSITIDDIILTIDNYFLK